MSDIPMWSRICQPFGCSLYCERDPYRRLYIVKHGPRGAPPDAINPESWIWVPEGGDGPEAKIREHHAYWRVEHDSR